jgi:hypothetical protein
MLSLFRREYWQFIRLTAPVSVKSEGSDRTSRVHTCWLNAGLPTGRLHLKCANLTL